MVTPSTTTTTSGVASLARRARLEIKRLSERATIPQLGSAQAAGLDLSSAQHLIIPAGERALVPTDLAIACPEGTYGRIAPRSGLAYKKGIDVGAGVIDADYRGPVGVILFNFGKEDFEIKQGDRIAQLILERICVPEIAVVDELDATHRGEAGFGSTGVAQKDVEEELPDAVAPQQGNGEQPTKKPRTISPTEQPSVAEDEANNTCVGNEGEKQ